MNTKDQPETSTLQAPLSQLERALIDAFVRARGYDPLKLAELPEREREQILTQASVHASAKLAEVEAKSHLIDEIRE
jgi:hypothetical protein